MGGDFPLKQRNPIRECIFCGGSPVTTEHVVGNWLRKAFPPEMKTLAKMHHISKTSNSGEQVAYRGMVGGQVPADYTAKIVCSNCNNDWMSRVEEAMKNACRKLNLNSIVILRHNTGSILDHISAIRLWMMHKTILHFAVSSFGFDEEDTFWPVDEAVKQYINYYYENKEMAGDQFLLAVPIATSNDLVGRWNLLTKDMICETDGRYLTMRAYSHFIPMKRFLFVMTNSRDHFEESSRQIVEAVQGMITSTRNGLNRMTYGNPISLGYADRIISDSWRSVFGVEQEIFPFTQGSPDLKFRPDG